MYLDQRSTVLAVDNLNGSKVLGRTLRVDHTRNYEQPKGRDEDGEVVEPEEQSMNALPSMVGGPSARGAIEAGGEDVDEEDPMAAYIRSERVSPVLRTLFPPVRLKCVLEMLILPCLVVVPFGPPAPRIPRSVDLIIVEAQKGQEGQEGQGAQAQASRSGQAQEG